MKKTIYLSKYGLGYVLNNLYLIWFYEHKTLGNDLVIDQSSISYTNKGLQEYFDLNLEGVTLLPKVTHRLKNYLTYEIPKLNQYDPNEILSGWYNYLINISLTPEVKSFIKSKLDSFELPQDYIAIHLRGQDKKEEADIARLDSIELNPKLTYYVLSDDKYYINGLASKYNIVYNEDNFKYVRLDDIVFQSNDAEYRKLHTLNALFDMYMGINAGIYLSDGHSNISLIISAIRKVLNKPVFDIRNNKQQQINRFLSLFRLSNCDQQFELLPEDSDLVKLSYITIENKKIKARLRRKEREREKLLLQGK